MDLFLRYFYYNIMLRIPTCFNLYGTIIGESYWSNQISHFCIDIDIRGLLEKYPTFDREKETALLGALDT